MSRKKRILFCNEASYLSTGFATYGKEVMSRLHAAGKYELGELASYGSKEEHRASSVPWAFFPVMPTSQREQEIYDSNSSNEFGEWRFEQACLAFRPDIVVDVRDWWMLEFEERSPFRSFYHWAIMPTVDAMPQDEQWISTYCNADAVFSYSDWGMEVLRKQAPGRIHLKCAAPPGADLKTMSPKPDRRAHRSEMGIDPHCFIVGTVMRNQKRKLYPDLIQAFAKFLKAAPEAMAKNTFLYLHTAFPDVGWDIPRLIKESGVGHKCVFTYCCKKCQSSFPLFYQDSRAVCRKCGAQEASFPTSQHGVRREVLSNVINCFDVYVQYANSEGFGMPQVEAASCGVPVFAVDYSAMSDVVRKLKGVPVAVKNLVRESETHCWRACPDNEDFVSKLIQFLKLPATIRAKRGFDSRRAVEQHYTYEKTAKVWEEHFDSVQLKPEHLTWGSTPRTHRPNINVPDGLSDDDFVRWGLVNVAGRPELLNSYMALRMVRDLTWGVSMPYTGGLYFNEMSTIGLRPRFRDFGRNEVMQEFMKMADQKNHWENERMKMLRSATR